MLESLFNKVADLQPAIKIATPALVFSREFCEIYQATFLQNTSERLPLFDAQSVKFMTY